MFSRAARRALCATALCTIALTSSACDESAEPTQPPVVRIGTYNAGLAHGFVELAAERRDAVVAGVASVDADVLCLQEVWIDEDVAAMTAGTAATFPFETHLRTEFNEIGPPACIEQDTADLRACIATNGCESSPDGLADCTLANCNDEFMALPNQCVSCIVANIALPYEELLLTCQNGSSLWTYEGRNGLMLLSKTALENTDTLELESCSTKRYAFYAETTTATGAEIGVVCTHLTAEITGVPHTCENAESWEAENAAQIDTLIGWAAERAGERPLFVTGDFNTGPTEGELVGELPANFPRFEAAGFVSPTVTASDQCSYCGDENTLTTATTTPRIIDHVFVTGVSPDNLAAASATRILDTPTEIDVAGTPTTTSLSDHFGFIVELRAD